MSLLGMIISLGLAIWLLVLSILFFLQKRVFDRLTKDIDEKDLVKILKDLLAEQKEDKKALALVQREIERIENEGRGHVQKVGLIRFNPFKEIGGDHSFSLAILDGGDTGIIITALHTRERTRIYAKPIRNGRSELELSTEEERALRSARRES